jgi:Spy/CpxP family protein refolding chaperone
MKRTLATMVMAGALALALPAAAQPEGARRAQVRQRIADYAMQQLTQQLGLDPATAARFREVADRYQPQIAGLHKEVGMAMKELKAQLGSPQPDAARLAQLADLILQSRQKVQTLEAQRTVENRRVLNPVQFAKLMVIWPQVNKQIKAEVWKAMHPGQQPPPEELE